MTFTLGCDPEIFVKKNGKPIAISETSLPGDKKEPFKTMYGAVQQDGAAAEFNTNPVQCQDFEGFNQNIVRTMADLRGFVGDVTIAKGVTVMDFSEEYMASLPDTTKELGCDPDYNAYTLLPNPRPDGDRLFRTAAGHVHVGWGADIPVDNAEHMEICSSFVKMMDATVGMFMTFIDREPRRRELYGKAGAFRPKSYGVEYRTPSNAWIWNRPRRLLFHYFTNLAINKMKEGYSAERVTGVPEGEIVNIINEGSWRQAVNVIDASFYIPHNLGPSWRAIKEEMEKVDG